MESDMRHSANVRLLWRLLYVQRWRWWFDIISYSYSIAVSLEPYYYTCIHYV